jgi:hypothetical protein
VIVSYAFTDVLNYYMDFKLCFLWIFVDLLDCELFDLSSVTYVTNVDLINKLN